jgi:hypothetical protein
MSDIIWQEGFYKGVFVKTVKEQTMDKITKEPVDYVLFKIIPTHLIKDGEQFKLNPTEPIEKRMKANTEQDRKKITNSIKMFTHGEYETISDFAKNCKKREVGIHYQKIKNENGREFAFWDFTIERIESDDFGDW